MLNKTIKNSYQKEILDRFKLHLLPIPCFSVFSPDGRAIGTRKQLFFTLWNYHAKKYIYTVFLYHKYFISEVWTKKQFLFTLRPGNRHQESLSAHVFQNRSWQFEWGGETDPRSHEDTFQPSLNINKWIVSKLFYIHFKLS